MCKSLSLAFNSVANKRAFLIAWRTSELLPFFKDGDKQNVANYRFISLLSCTSKIVETLVYGKLFEVIKDIIAPWTIRLPQKPIVHHADDNVYEWNFWQPRFGNLSNHVLGLRKCLGQGLAWKVIEKLTNEGPKNEGIIDWSKAIWKEESRKVKLDHLSRVNLLCKVEPHKDLYLDLHFLSFLSTIFQNVSCQLALDMRMTIRL